MFFIDFFPQWLLFVVILGAFLSIISAHILQHIPVIGQYSTLITVAGAFVLFAGAFFYGVKTCNQSWKEESARLQAAVDAAEERARQVTSKIEYKFIDRVRVVRSTQVVVQEKIKEVSQKIDSSCTVAAEAIDLHNAAADNKVPGAQK
jgi:hypothetical protein